MREYYRAKKPASQLQQLTVEMLKAPGKPAKLRSKAAECRYLIPFGVQVANEHRDGTPYRETVFHVINYLGEIQKLLTQQPFPQGQCAEYSRKLCLLYTALWDHCGRGHYWKIKPKLHLFQELMEFSNAGSPRDYWCYKDEDWGAQAASSASSRGGHHSAAKVSLNAVSRYRALTHNRQSTASAA
jgi:hypothetical protein